MSVIGQMLDEADEQAALYYRALEDLTCLIEPAEGAEDCLPPQKVIRNAVVELCALNPRPIDTITMLEVLAHRFDEVLDREDLDL
ncbi:MAG TPA: hypothetical protein VK571_08710 [Gemmatimonadaceae bacterium]|nr:hypothetical protein [Gemmatimonadaceae bacterium]